MDTKDYEKRIKISIKSDEGDKKLSKFLEEVILHRQKSSGYIKPWYECNFNGGADNWNTGFCDNDCRSCSYSDGFALVNKKKYQFKKHLTEEEVINHKFISYKEYRIYEKLNKDEINK